MLAAVAFGVVGIATAGAAPAGGQSIAGIWATGSEGARVQIYQCGAALCGKIIDATRIRANPDQRDERNPDRALRSRKLMGLVVLSDFTGGPSEWKGGPVYDPETGDGAATGYLKLRADAKLEVKGCRAFFCRTKVWTRAR
ncbi:DUF2147 domain-containing protein [Sphingopyxis granuli]|uniref:Conserved Putative secreted protein n=1 Tax=Sphingopyxis granuli TaxID=267128 RepID=A0AA86GKI6_9SPHN|nr:DUF2147 domain-containing protein [Sphingopyxis granuli]AMG74609.1 Conserved Putative secreted protein [Sphingopyxis granuli]